MNGIPPERHEERLQRIGKHICSLLNLRHAEVITEEAYNRAIHGLRDRAVKVIEEAKLDTFNTVGGYLNGMKTERNK